MSMSLKMKKMWREEISVIMISQLITSNDDMLMRIAAKRLTTEKYSDKMLMKHNILMLVVDHFPNELTAKVMNHYMEPIWEETHQNGYVGDDEGEEEQKENVVPVVEVKEPKKRKDRQRKRHVYAPY
ncbi:unnamed protein product [Caenorhabditis sp. 36 PRJEB53466]|nr:unnamed protein product [Caenorhabditis sp. 36 PRJEB53466]